MIETLVVVYCIGVFIFALCLVHYAYTCICADIRAKEQAAMKIWFIEQYKNTGAYAKHSSSNTEITAPLKTYDSQK